MDADMRKTLHLIDEGQYSENRIAIANSIKSAKEAWKDVQAYARKLLEVPCNAIVQ